MPKPQGGEGEVSRSDGRAGRLRAGSADLEWASSVLFVLFRSPSGLFPILFWGESSRTKVDYRKKLVLLF